MTELCIGTVVANSDVGDPKNKEALGRVLVFIRNVSDHGQSEDFVNPRGDNLCRKMSSDTIDRVFNTEVWAYVLQPNSGGAPGHWSPGSNITRPSNDSDDNKSLTKKAPAASQRNVSGGNDGSDGGSAGNNTYDKSYRADNKDGAVKGTFSIPDIGATVLVGFINGKRGIPVVLGVLMGSEAIASIHRAGDESGPMPDHPGEGQGTPDKPNDDSASSDDEPNDDASAVSADAEARERALTYQKQRLNILDTVNKNIKVLENKKGRRGGGLSDAERVRLNKLYDQRKEYSA